MNGKHTVRLGLLGAGAWGQNLLRNFHALEALAAFASIRAKSREAVAQAYPGIELHETPEALFAAANVDGVIIATPPATHTDLAARALSAGKHAFVEKPLCLDLAEAERLRDLAVGCGLVLMTNHHLIYHPAFCALRSLVSCGAIGRLRYVYSHRLFPPRPRLQESALWELAPHDVSMLLAVTGALPQRVTSAGGPSPSPPGADGIISNLSFPDRLGAHLFVSFCHPFKEQRFVAAGENGMIVFEDSAEGTGKLRLYRHSLDDQDDRRIPLQAEYEAIPYTADEPLRLSCAAFVAAVRGERSAASHAEEGLRVLRVLAACQRSLTSGVAVDVKNGTGLARPACDIAQR